VNKIFIFSGKARAGKDTASNYVKSQLENQKLKVAQLLYAKYIKGYAKDYFNWNGSEKTKPRKFLQEIGTDIIRNKLNKPNFHVNRICEDIEILSSYFDVFTISDCRFPNEILTPKKKFGKKVIAIKIIRTNFKSKLTKKQQEHESETALDNFTNFDYVIKSENIPNLYKELDVILKKEMSNE